MSGSGKCFLVEVPDRSARTLQDKITEFILPGTHIISDGWAAYAQIPNIRHGIYTHEVIIHQQHFVDPWNEDIHTENIENMWMRAKRKLRRQFGTSRNLFPSYLHEFKYRNYYRDTDVFSNFVVDVSDSYPV